jgi:hypothetical protein
MPRAKMELAEPEKLGTCESRILPLICCLLMAMIIASTTRGAMSMPRKLFGRNRVKGPIYSFGGGEGPRIGLPNDPTGRESITACRAALQGQSVAHQQQPTLDIPGTIGALITSYEKGSECVGLDAGVNQHLASTLGCSTEIAEAKPDVENALPRLKRLLAGAGGGACAIAIRTRHRRGGSTEDREALVWPPPWASGNRLQPVTKAIGSSIMYCR